MAAPSGTTTRRWLRLTIEIALVVIILGLLLLTWLPALIGPHAGPPPR